MEKIIGLIIGVLLLGGGIYYLTTAKEDPEAKKIYTVASGIGALITAICALLLFL